MFSLVISPQRHRGAQRMHREIHFSDSLLRGLDSILAALPSAEALGYFQTSAMRTKTAVLLPPSLLQQLFQIPLPDRRNRMRAVAASLIADRNHDEAAALDAFDLALDNSQFRWVDKIIGGIDRDKRRFDRFQLRRGIVFAGRIDLIKQIVGVKTRDRRLHAILVKFVNGFACRRLLLPE